MSDIEQIAHDPDAFEAFYRRHVAEVTRFIARRVDDPYTAADLTAEVFLAVIESAHTYRADRGTPIAWVFGVAHRVLAAERRRAWRESNTNRRIAGRRLLDPADVARLEERIDAERSARRVYEALADLPAGTDCEEPRGDFVARDEVTRALVSWGPFGDRDGDPYWKPHPEFLGPDQTFVYTVHLGRDANGERFQHAVIRVANGPVQPCVRVPAG